MGSSRKPGLSRAQLQDGARRVQTLALRDGANWTIWASAKASMEALDIDLMDLRRALMRFAVTDYEVWGESVRYVGQGKDTDERYLVIKCAPHDELVIIEVFAVHTL